jgi:sialate O-acetylesterase
MKKSIAAFLAVSFLVQSVAAFAAIRLPAVISSSMVLQQRSDARLWGWSEPGEKIFVTTSWNGRIDSVVASGNAVWEINVPTPAAGGPYTITLKGRNTIVLEDILIGEVWVCSGQSNMEWSSDNNLKQIMDEMPNSFNSSIRLFYIPKTTATTPQDDCQGKWKVSSPEALPGFSAIAYFFGKKLQQQLKVPIGLISTSWGGTPAETWTPAETVTKETDLATAAKELKPSKWWPVESGLAYNAMIYPITRFSIAGAIWYQGESNTGTAATYKKLFSSMIQDWRNAWKKEFPFYFVQIAPYTYGNNNIGALLREQQWQTLTAVPRTGMVVTTDLVDDIKNIHPNDKSSVANRLADWALMENYHKNVLAYQSPALTKTEINGDQVILSFDHAPNGLITKGNSKPTEFLIAGEDKVFVSADVKIEKDRLTVSSKQVKKPVAVRFGFSNTATPNLFSKEGLPVIPFRTDTWKVDTSKTK